MNIKEEKKQHVGLKRDTIDKYYTSKTTVDECVDLFINNINITKEDVIIEPSAGNGAFIESLRKIGCSVLCYDIEPQHKEIIKNDYLKLEIPDKTKYKRFFVIGNPPFGRQSSLAIKFIKKSCEYCDVLGFILPKSFKKNSMKRCFPLNFHLIIEEDVKENSFIVNGNSYNVPCVFQIWEKREEVRNIEEKIIPNGYKFVKKTDVPKAHISFRRVGVNAGKITKDIDNKSDQSHYFIRFDCVEILNDEVYNKLCCLKYENCDNTVGPRSISKQELIREFNFIF